MGNARAEKPRAGKAEQDEQADAERHVEGSLRAGLQSRKPKRAASWG